MTPAAPTTDSHTPAAADAPATATPTAAATATEAPRALGVGGIVAGAANADAATEEPAPSEPDDGSTDGEETAEDARIPEGELIIQPTPTEGQASSSSGISATPISSPFAGEAAPAARVYSNGNYVNDVAIMPSTIWAATDGGVVAWNKDTGGYVKFTILDGLSTNRTLVAAVCQLPGLGVLFGSEQGIEVFNTQDGSWQTLHSNNSDMRYDNVSALWCNAEAGLLVVGYAAQGFDVFDANTEEWRYIGEADGLTFTGIRRIAVDLNGPIIWLATNEGLVAYSEENITRYTSANSPLAEDRIESLALDGAGALWLTAGSALYRTHNGEWRSFTGASADFPNGRLTGLALSNNGAVWVGSDQAQVCRFDPGIEGCVAFFDDNDGMATHRLTRLTVSEEGEVYYTTAGGGISLFAEETWRQLQIEEEAIAGNSLHDLALAADGAVWTAATGGASRIDPSGGTASQNFTPANSPLTSVNVRVVQPTAEGGAWIGADGLHYFDGAEWTSYGVEDGLAGATIQAIAADNQGRIWVATDAGLSIWTGSTFFNLTSQNGLPNDDITALETNGSVVWIGTRSGGLLRFEDNQLQLFNAGNSNLPSNNITALALNASGVLYIGTEAGMATFTANELQGDAGLGQSEITTLATAPNGEIWAATAGAGLQRFDGVSWHAFAPNELPAQPIQALLVDSDGALWVGSAQSGLVRFAP